MLYLSYYRSLDYGRKYNCNNVINIKKEKIKLVVLVVSILMIASSVSYAFFVAGVSDPANTDVNLGTEVSGGLVFTPGTPINLTANLTNFAEGDGSLSGETTSTANLKAASSTGSATENYYIYYNVTSNNFVYTKDNTTPELLLTITDPEGNEITALTNHPELTHKTVTDAVIGNVSGFDVTTYEGLILIDDSYTISTTDSTIGTTQEWKAKLTFVNLDTIQTENEGKVFESTLILRSDEFSMPITEAVLMNSGGVEFIEAKPEPDFSVASVTNEGMFAAPDDYGTSYYYRGAVDNNWVYFAGFYWRIIRINGDGSVRLIYSGEHAPTEEEKVVRSNMDLPASVYNSNIIGTFSGNAEYVGYMYTMGSRHGYGNDSTIKTVIDSWYEENIFNTEYVNFLSDVVYCNDRSNFHYYGTNGTGVGDNDTYFSFAERNASNNYSLVCPLKNDSFTVDDIVNGNGALKYPIAIITADEYILSGGINTGTESISFLNGKAQHTMTPLKYTNGISSGDNIYFSVIWHYNLRTTISIFGMSNRNDPVLSIKGDSLAKGDGTWENPYIII